VRFYEWRGLNCYDSSSIQISTFTALQVDSPVTNRFRLWYSYLTDDF
jgi:hypothetical protein